MKKIYRILSLLMTVAMLLCMVPVTAAAETVDPKQIDKYIIDCRNEEAFNTYAKYYEHTPLPHEPDPFTGGKYNFNAEKQAMQIEYYPTGIQTPIHLHFHANEKKLLSAEFKYFVLVYSVKSSADYRISLWNSPKFGVEGVICENGKDTGGKFVISEPVDISQKDADGRNLLDRWIYEGQNSLSLETTDKNAEFYVKEMGFFKSPEDAKAYYASADLSKPSSYYEKPIDTTIPVDFTVFEEDTVVIDPATEVQPAVLPKPVIMSFESEEKFGENALFTEHNENEAGGYEFATAPDGTGALKINYLPYQGFSAFRTMPAFIKKGTVNANHKYMRITYMTNDKVGGSLTLRNNKTSEKLTFAENCSVSGGRWITTNPVEISKAGHLQRYIGGIHCTLEYNTMSSNADFYIKEIAFFGSVKQAYDYYGDSYSADNGKYSAMTFGDEGTGELVLGDRYGNVALDPADNAAVITYTEGGSNIGMYYAGKLKMTESGTTGIDQTWVRVLFSAKNPEGVDNADMFIRNDKVVTDVIRLVEDIPDTGGEYILSDAVKMPYDMTGRFSGQGPYGGTLHNTFFVNTKAKGGEYRIKAVYFFSTKAGADNFELTDLIHNVKLGGADISEYRIIVPTEYEERLTGYANDIKKQIKALTGVEIPVLNDSAKENKYEILIGRTNRDASEYIPEGVKVGDENEFQNFWITMKGTKLVIGSTIPLGIVDAADIFNRTVLYKGGGSAPAEITFTEADTIIGRTTTIREMTCWVEPENLKVPESFNVDFDTDEGWFNEDNGEKRFTYNDGKLNVKEGVFAASYLHTYEKNVTVKGEFTPDSSKDGSFGLMARVNSEDAYVKGGYDFAKGAWYIESRDGWDFYIERTAEESAKLEAGKTYTLELKVDGEKASLTVDGKTVIKDAKLHHFSAGRIGVYSDHVTLAFDNFTLLNYSAESTILKNVHHTKLPYDDYLEGGTVTEMTDGSLVYNHQSGVCYISNDGGITWNKGTSPITTTGYVNIMRIANGDLIKIDKSGNAMYSFTSSDDGKTWVQGGRICAATYPDSVAQAGNMNDKITQSGMYGRIYYCQNYEASANMPVNGKYTVFCEFYYSDDNGKTWTKSETDSWDIEGIKDEAQFGECKIIECADGTLRMYNSWNWSGYILYSESNDGGKTFGPIQKLKGFDSCHSSMQIVRDTYADNDTTYYMVWVDDHGSSSRSSLALAISYDGKTWTKLGDIWRWESTYQNDTAPINHVVDPFIKTTADYVICGSGFSDHTKKDGELGGEWHQGQRQHIYAIKKDTLTVPEALYDFTDVDTNDSFYEGVKFAVDNGLFNGTSATTFDPYVTMNRAMFVTVLGRLDKADVSKYTTPTFDDVKAGEWYTSYVEWAAANGIVNGMGGGKYGVTGTITVEQACTILYRYSGGKTAADASGKTLADFTDSASVSAWAADGVKWAVENGIYEGANGKLEPTSPASRALVATMFANYVKLVGTR